MLREDTATKLENTTHMRLFLDYFIFFVVEGPLISICFFPQAPVITVDHNHETNEATAESGFSSAEGEKTNFSFSLLYLQR